MRFRTTAPPSAFFTLMPKRLDAAGRERLAGNLALAQSSRPGASLGSASLRAEENCKLRARAALTRAIYGFVFDAFQQTHGTRKILPRTVRIF